MSFLEQYLSRANEIIGERTAEEEKYDKEALRWLSKGKPIGKAIARANKKYPSEAIEVSDEDIDDVQAHYEYQLGHEDIMRKLKKLR